MEDTTDPPARIRMEHDWSTSDDVSSTVVQAVARYIGADPTGLEPLYQVLDPDALDQLVRSFRKRSGDSAEAEVHFDFEGCAVTVRPDGTVLVESST